MRLDRTIGQRSGFSVSISSRITLHACRRVFKSILLARCRRQWQLRRRRRRWRRRRGFAYGMLQVRDPSVYRNALACTRAAGRPAWQRAYTFTHAHIHTSKTRVHIPRVRRPSTAERLIAADRGVTDESGDGSTDGQEERRWTRLVSGGVLHRSTVADSSFAWLVGEASLHLAVQRQPATTSSRQLTDALCCRMSVCYVQLYSTTQQYGSVATNKTEININIQFSHTRITHRRACMHA